jgi:hypothetical protein
LASLPADADPAYSTPIDYDADVDHNLTTARHVQDQTGEGPGAVTIDTRRRKLYLSLGSGEAIEYGVGIGRQGFSWKGVAQIGRKAFWPGRTPPSAQSSTASGSTWGRALGKLRRSRRSARFRPPCVTGKSTACGSTITAKWPSIWPSKHVVPTAGA